MITQYTIKCDFPDCERREYVANLLHLFDDVGWVSNNAGTKHLCREHRIFEWDQVNQRKNYNKELVKKAGHELS